MKNLSKCLSVIAVLGFAACSSKPVPPPTPEAQMNHPQTRETASAGGNYVLKTKKMTSPEYGQINITYPQLANTASTKYKARINVAIQKAANEMHCDGQNSGDQFTFNADTKVESVNSNYFAFTMDQDAECSGAHPSEYPESFVFSMATGQRVMIEKELGMDPDGDFDRKEAVKANLAKLIVTQVPRDMIGDATGCYTGKKQDDAYTIAMDDFILSLKDKTVVVHLNPNFATEACGFDAHLTYAQVAPYLKKGSILNHWLK